MYFIILIFVFHLFILNMFVGIVINVFGQEKQVLEMNHLLTETELDWCEVMIYCYKSKPTVRFISTDNVITDTCYCIVTMPIFDSAVFTCIILNTVCLALTWTDEPHSLKGIIAWINLFFNIVYTIEAIMKLIAFKSDYFLDGWNNFDFMIVIVAWIGMLLKTFDIDLGASTNVIRMLRISRIFKIVKKYKNLRVLFYTFIGAIP